MKIQHIRNATLVIEYAGKKFLIDPFLSPKGTYPPFPNSTRQDEKNPLTDLPVSVEDIIDADAVIVTHLHLDHWDDAAKETLPKDIKLFSQNEEDAQTIRDAGFQNVEVLGADSSFEGIQLIKTKGEHGRGPILQRTGLVCGVVLKHDTEKTLYVAGDTVWYEGVQEALNTHQPEVIVVNAGDNQFLEGGSLVMGKEDVQAVHEAAPDAQIVAVHMEAVNHWALSREELRRFAEEQGMAAKLAVPNDGDSFTF